MDIRLAIFYLEHPLALHRDFPERSAREAVLNRMDRTIEGAKRNSSLHWQAYEARAKKRLVSTSEAARRNFAFERLGGTVPPPPPTPDF